jgi:hypothetical protein
MKGSQGNDYVRVVGAIVLIGISDAMAMGWLLPGRLAAAASGESCTVTSNMSG